MATLLSIRIRLDAAAVSALMRPVVGSGGFQSLLRALQKSLDQEGTLTLTPDLVARIAHYVKSYGEGGFQGRLDFILRELTDLARSLRPMAA